MTKGFLTIAAVLALVLIFAAAAVPETEPITAPEPMVSAQIPTARYRLTADERELFHKTQKRRKENAGKIHTLIRRPLHNTRAVR